MDDPAFNKKYQNCKLKVKLWEKKFKTKYGRIPSKHDIREASNDIRYAYKMYYKLKTSILEDTLNDVLLDDETDGFDLSNTLSQNELNFSLCDFSLESQLKVCDTTLSNISNIDNDTNLLINETTKENPKDFIAEEKSEINENAWGVHLNHKRDDNKKTESPVQRNKKKIGLKPELINAKISIKRNPRKSLSKYLNSSRKSDEFKTNLSENVEKLPDLETILVAKSLERDKIPKQFYTQPSTSSLPRNINLNGAWLDRCNSTNSLNLDKSDSTVTENLLHTFSKSDDNFEKGSISNNLGPSSTSFGISSLRLNSTLGSTSSLISESTNKFISSENIFDKSINPSDDGGESDIIANSDEESVTLTARHIRKKRKIVKETMQENKSQLVEVEKLNVVKDLLETDVQPEVQVREMEINKTKKAKASKKTIRPKVATRPPIKILKKRAVRSKVKSYVDTNHDTDENVEEDPFACDSDQDPEYKIKSDTEESVVEKVAQSSRKKTSPSSKTKLKEKKQLKSKSLRKKVMKKGDTSKTSDNETKFVEYIPDIEIGNIHNVPRIEISDLEKNTKLFQNYIIDSIKSKSIDKSLQNPLKEISDNPDKKKLDDKIASGKLNENFVRINIKKKVFVRGKKVFNFSRYKKNLWKKKKAAALTGENMDMGGCDGGVLSCFLCGGVGHFARNCKVKGDDLLPNDVEVEEESQFPTLEEVDRMAKNELLKVHANNPSRLPSIDNPIWKDTKDNTKMNVDDEINDININLALNDLPIKPPKTITKQSFIGHRIPEDIVRNSGILELSKIINNDQTKSFYSLNNDDSLIATPNEVFDALKLFGHLNFRSGQEKAIMRILSGKSTLVTLSTGSGKSLCYQLPAYLYAKKMKFCTLVVSPLVSLMEDQVDGVPSFLNAQCLHTNQTPKVKEKIMAMIDEKKLDVLLISPEAIVASESSTGFRSVFSRLPPIAFACIDEAHCVSQWSHNFRPSYLMICRVLKERLGIKTILGLTATATRQTCDSIIRHLEIPDGVDGVISDIPLPDNLQLSISRDQDRDYALVNLLKSERFEKCNSIIVYCTRRDECERIASFLRTTFQNNKPLESEKSKKRKRFDWNAEPYHAGLPAYRRRTIQNAFMSGDLRICVATIAFGMGINKSDIRAVIHYNMPKSFESYVQEVGRAGRDGNLAHCHLFLDAKRGDQNELRRHIFANSIDRHVIRKLLQKIFVPCACKKNQKSSNEKNKRICPGHEVCFSVEETVAALDIPEENISTILCYLELQDQRFIKVMSKAYMMCKVFSYGGAKQLRTVAQTCPPLAMAIALDLKNGINHDDTTMLEFPVINVAAAIGWDSGVVKYQLKNLEWTNKDGYPKRSSISVNFFNLAFRVRAPGDLSDEELDNTLDYLFERVSRQERAELIQLQCVFNALNLVSYPSYLPVSKHDFPTEKSNELKSIIRNYFKENIDMNIALDEVKDNTSDDMLRGDIYTMISRYPENSFTGRTLARIFHGCQSPNYPAVIWGRCKFWRAHLNVDFNRIVTLANAEIVKMRRQS